MFTNVFVNPASYRAFVGSGRWPDKTIFMLEVRHTGTDRRPNRAGLFQAEAVGLEAHVLDASKGGSRFYDFDGKSSGSPLPATSSCNTCHAEHGAVDNTFVQFYPELLTVAKAKGTIKAGFDADPAATSPESGSAGVQLSGPPARGQLTRAPGRSPRPYLAFRLQPRSPVPQEPGLLRRSAGRLPGGQGARHGPGRHHRSRQHRRRARAAEPGARRARRDPRRGGVVLAAGRRRDRSRQARRGPLRHVGDDRDGASRAAAAARQRPRGRRLPARGRHLLRVQSPVPLLPGPAAARALPRAADRRGAGDRNAQRRDAAGAQPAGGGAGAIPRQGRRRRQRRAHAAPRRHDVDGGAGRDARGVPGQRRGGARPRRRRPRRHVPARRRHLRRHRAVLAEPGRACAATRSACRGGSWARASRWRRCPASSCR